jgi:ABC-type branched-subunit amino acid transport system substrate-binding protein
MKHSTKLVTVVSVAIMATALAGCSAPASSTTAKTGEGITVMVIESMTGLAGVDQSAPKGAEAAAETINAAGGIDGRNITVLSCDTATDPNKGAQCVRDAIAKGVIAVVGSFDPLSTGVMLPLLEKANIPFIASVATQEPEYTSPVSFPVAGGASAATFGMVPATVSLGCKKVVTWSDPATDSGLGKRLLASWKSAGIDASAVNLPLGTSDISPVVSQALSGHPDCIAFVGAGPQASQIFAAVRSSGSDAKIVSAYGTLYPPVVASMGALGNGITVVSDVPFSDDPALADYRSQIKKFAPDVTDPNQFTLMAWYSIQVLQQAMKGNDITTSAELVKQLSTMKDVKLPGLPQPVSFTSDGASATAYPRMFNTQIQFATLKDGKYVPDGKGWSDVLKYLPAAK